MGLHAAKLLLSLLALILLGCPADDGDPDPSPPPPPAPLGPAVIMVGEETPSSDPLVALTEDMETWTWVPQAESNITAGAALTFVVRVPVTNRLVAVASPASGHDELWYNDTRGEGAWSQASFSTSGTEDNLDPEHRDGAGGGYDDWSIHEIFFVNQDDGYAVGDRSVVLRTFDGGATWHDMNVFHDGDGAVELWSVDNVSQVPTVGTVVGNASAAPGATAEVVSYEYAGATSGLLTVSSVTGTWSHGSDDIFVGTTDVADTVSVADDTVWLFDTEDLRSLHVTENGAGNQTLWLGAGAAADMAGLWRLSSDAAAGAGRAFTWYPPSTAVQQQFASLAVQGLFFFDSATGLAGTTDGVYYTTTGSDWTRFAGTASSSFHRFAYASDTLQASAYLYSVNGSTNAPGRVLVTYTAGLVWSLGSTPAWTEHGDGANYGITWVDGSTHVFHHGGRIFCMDDYNNTAGEWGYGETLDGTGFDDTVWQDTGDLDLGGTAGNGANPAYRKGALDEAAAPTGIMHAMAMR